MSARTRSGRRDRHLVIKIVGGIVFAVGSLSCSWGWVLQLVRPGPDANIGAGLFVVFGLPAAGVGILVIMFGFAVEHFFRREPPES